MNKKYTFMNVLRVLSMISIVFYHMIFTLYLYGIRQLDSISYTFQNANIHIGKIGVGLFFILSGAGLMHSSILYGFDVKDFYKKRFLKILVPFYITYLGYFIFLLCTQTISITNPFAGKEIKLYSFIFTLLGMDAYVDSFGVPTCSLGIGEWFLGCLILIYAIFPILRWAMHKNRYVTMVIATLYYVVINIYYDRIPFINHVPMYTNMCIKIYDFILGMFLAYYIEKSFKWELWAGLLIVLFFVVYPTTLPGVDSFQIPVQCLGFYFIFKSLEPLFDKTNTFKKVMDKASLYSYEYFLVHHVVILHLSTFGINTDFGNAKVILLFVKEIILTVILAIILKRVTRAVTMRFRKLNKLF